MSQNKGNDDGPRSGSNSSSNNAKRKKGWRSGGVSSGGGPSPPAMSPEAVIQQATTTSNARQNEVKISFGPSRPPQSSSFSQPQQQQQQPQSFLPSNAARISSGAGGVGGGPAFGGVNFGNLDFNALKETAAAAAAASSGRSNSNTKNKKGGKKNGTNTSTAAGGLPCSEAEMKALMSMFVEIMGMSMDTDGSGNNNNNHFGANKQNISTDNNNTSSNKKKGPVFMFGGGNHNGSGTPPPGWPDQESMAAATAGFFADGASWEAIRRTYGAVTGDLDDDDDDDDDDDYDEDYEDEDDHDSLPDLEDVREMFGKDTAASDLLQQMANPNHPAMSNNIHNINNDNKIAPGSAAWDPLEQAAIDDALDAELRARRAAKKREKKQRKKQKQKEEAAQKAAEAAQKKREKAILSWRSRVASACQANELAKLEALLQESPLGKNVDEDEKNHRSTMAPHLEFLIPSAFAKNRSLLDRGRDARHQLAIHLLTMDISTALRPLRSGRTALHSACFHGDIPFVQLVLEKLAKYDKDAMNEQIALPEDCLNQTCEESGWSPLHYASLSGSIEMLEELLAAGCKVTTITDDTHTWRESDGIGVTPKELVQYISDGSYEEVLESHGVALQEMENSFFGSQQERRTFLRTLDRVLKRLSEVEKNGYSAPESVDNTALSVVESEENSIQDQSEPHNATSSRKKKKKKKKKQAQKEAAAAAATDSQTPTSSTKNIISGETSPPSEEQQQEENDPLVTALIGMGFEKEQIMFAVKACGGTNRATADDLVTWILGQDGDMAETETTQQQSEAVEINERTTVKASADDDTKLTEQEEARQKEEAARRLAAKREEQRRRNREWNNRELARQEQETKTKIAQVVTAPKPVVQPVTPAYSNAFPSLSSTVPVNSSPGLQTGLPSGRVSGLQGGLQPAVPPKPGPPRAEKSAPAAPVSAATKYNPSPATEAFPPSKGPLAHRSANAEFPSQKMKPTPQMKEVADDTKLPPGMPSSSVMHPASRYNNFAPIGDDDRTVSSFGSNRGLSVSSNSFLPSLGPMSSNPVASAAPPPGFKPPSAAPVLHPSMSQPRGAVGFEAAIPPTSNLPVDLNATGEMRATAKAFVPAGFTPAAAAPPPRLSSNFAAQSGVSMQNSSDIPLARPFDNAATLGSSLLHPGSGTSLLSSAMPNNTNTYDSVPSVTPTEDSISPLGVSLGFGSEPAGSSRTSSLLTSAFTSGPPPPASSIWGGSSSQPVVPLLNGLSSVSYGDENSDRKTGDSNTVGWGGIAPSNRPGLSGGSGSIW